MKFVKKPTIVDAVQYDGSNIRQIIEELGEFEYYDVEIMSNNIYIKTLEGNMLVTVGDWIIRGIAGEHYSCKEDIFMQLHKELDVTESNFHHKITKYKENNATEMLKKLSSDKFNAHLKDLNEEFKNANVLYGRYMDEDSDYTE